MTVRRIGGLAALALLLLSGLASAETVRTTSRLNLRQEPSTSSARIELLPAGRELEVISRSGLWIRVRAGAQEGWVHSDYVVDTALAGATTEGAVDPVRAARDAELARDVARLRVRKLEQELERMRASAPGAVREAATLRAEVLELNDRVADRERQIAELVEAIATGLETPPPSDGRAPVRGGPEADAVETAGLTARVGELEDELASLREGLAMRDAELAGSQVEAARLTTVAQGLERELEKARADLSEQRDQTRALEARGAAGAAELLGAAEREVTALTAERDRLDERLGEIEREAADAREAAARREVEIAELERRVAAGAGAAQTLATREGELARLAAEREELLESTAQLEAELAAARGRSAARTAELAEARQALAERDDAQAALRGSATAAGKEIRERDTRIAQLEAARDGAASEAASALRQVKAELEERDAALAALRGSATAAGEEIRERDTRIAQLEAARDRAVSEAASALRQAKAELEERDAALAALRGSATAAGEEIRERDSRIAQLEAARDRAVGGAASALRQAEVELEERDAALALAREERDRLAATAAEREANGRRYADALFELQNWSDQAEVEIARLGAENAKLTATVGELRSKDSRRREPLRRQLAAAESETAAVEERLAAADRDLSRLRQESDETETALGAARAELAEAAAGEEEERVARERAQREAREIGDRLATAEASQAELGSQLAQLRQERASGDDDLARRVTELTAEADRLREVLAAAELREGQALAGRTEAERRAAAADETGRRLAATNERLETLLAERRAAAPAVPLESTTEPPVIVPVAPAEPLVVAAGASDENLVRVAEPLAESKPEAPAREPDPAASPGMDAIDAVQRWAQAWSLQDVDRYLASYGAGFQPSNGQGRAAWAAQRRVRLSRPSFIEVEVSDLQLSVLAPDRFAVRFRQDYRSDSFADRVRKILELTREGTEWKIVREAVE